MLLPNSPLSDFVPVHEDPALTLEPSGTKTSIILLSDLQLTTPPSASALSPEVLWDDCSWLFSLGTSAPAGDPRTLQSLDLGVRSYICTLAAAASGVCFASVRTATAPSDVGFPVIAALQPLLLASCACAKPEHYVAVVCKRGCTETCVNMLAVWRHACAC